MEGDELYRLVNSAEDAADILEKSLENFRETVKDYNNTTDCSTETERPVSYEMLAQEAHRTLGMAYKAQDIRKQLYNARNETENVKNFRFKDGRTYNGQKLLRQIENNLDRYDKLLEDIWHVGYSISENPEIKLDPVKINKRKKARENLGGEEWSALGEFLSEKQKSSTERFYTRKTEGRPEQ